MLNIRAGLDLDAATGSLIARPQRIVPVIILPAIRLWVPCERQEDYPPGIWMSANIDGLVTGVDPGYSQETYGAMVGPYATQYEPIPPDVGPVPEIQWRSEASRITVSSPPADLRMIQRRMDEYEDRLFLSLFGAPRESVPNLHEHTPADEDLVATLLDFASAGDAEGFRALALMRGVPSAEVPSMWDGTLKRLGKKAAASPIVAD